MVEKVPDEVDPEKIIEIVECKKMRYSSSKR